MAEIDKGFVRHTSHRSRFLEECYLCKAEFDGKSDIFMYRGEMGFCSEECRNEQIEIEEEKERIMMKKMKASSRKKKSNSSSSSSSSAGDKRVAVQYANTTAVIT
ncbi:hypothetical protein ZOSMA_267G00050 [Zostera marina]|uniref:FLZ-type domain-containing protein n=1 Tax=Zostera marina TaxID=29655 RepID=A0A0K9PGU1_ZOSMR|nr:hypothetical protein ZOSMA_267G00050 [Zostera marina]